MKVIFKKNKVNDKTIYDFDKFDEDTSFFNLLYGDIYAGTLDIREVDEQFRYPLLFVDKNTVVGLFFKSDVPGSKYRPLTKKYAEKIEVVIEDGTDYSDIYNNLQKEIHDIDEYLRDCEDNEVEELLDERGKLRDEADAILEPTSYYEIYEIEDEIEEENLVKKFGIGLGMGVCLGIGIYRLVKKLRK